LQNPRNGLCCSGIFFTMKILCFFFSLSLSFAGIAYGQSSFSANRPGQVNNPDILPGGNFMIETGFQYGKSLGSKNFLLPTTALRYGLNGNIEISLKADNIYQVDNSLFGLTSYSIGSKIAICDQNNLLPKITFVTGFILPFAGLESLRPENSGGLIQLAMSHTLGGKCTVYSNFGATWTGNDPFPVYNYVLSLYYSPFSRFWTFAELYGLVPEHGSTSMATDFGFSYLARDNFQIDLSLGTDLNDPKNNHFIQIGAAVQIVKMKKQ
jgi:hypothetical protein